VGGRGGEEEDQREEVRFQGTSRLLTFTSKTDARCFSISSSTQDHDDDHNQDKDKDEDHEDDHDDKEDNRLIE